MKKFEWKSVLALTLTGALALGLTACGSSDNGCHRFVSAIVWRQSDHKVLHDKIKSYQDHLDESVYDQTNNDLQVLRGSFLFLHQCRQCGIMA